MATLTQISQALNDLLPKLKPLSMPTGMLGHFYSVPDGWLLCNGAAVSRSTYAALFAVIGTKHGSGDGSTTFNLPNLANRFVEGTTSIGSAGTFKSAGLPNISGSHNGTPWVTESSGAFSMVSQNVNVPGGGASSTNAVNFYASRTSSIYGSSATVQPPSISLLPCIRT
ncbi:phage tail protein [Sutterella wadsworthensis]|jgi:microcystin-dependent protein|uniref:phage tail protein n=1 Tax=Sutterella wadsworthensis TaxID=40545 RepID=UPI00307FFD13